MSLNAEASIANSSCPFTGTRSVSRPRAIPCAASASPLSVRTIDRPSKYATMDTSSSDASSPSRSRSREVAFAASISDLRAEHGEAHVGAVAGGRSDERPVAVAGDANRSSSAPATSATEPFTSGDDATIFDPWSAASASVGASPERLRSASTSVVSYGT